MGIMYYAQYLHLFERARSEFIRVQGMGYADIEKRGVFLPVREAQCRYRQPCRYDELIWIRTAISDFGRASLKFAYEIRDSDKARLLADGMTQHALVTREGQPMRMPEWFRLLLSNPEKI